MVFQHPWDEKKLLVRRVKSFYQAGSTKDSQLVWVASETLNGGIDSLMRRLTAPLRITKRRIRMMRPSSLRGSSSSNRIAPVLLLRFCFKRVCLFHTACQIHFFAILTMGKDSFISSECLTVLA